MTTRSQRRVTDERSRTAFDPTASERRTNLGQWERAASAAIGAALVVRGARRRSLGGVASATVGAALLTRGVTGHSRLYERLESDTVSGHERPGSERPVRGPAVERTITVGESADELEIYWRDPEHLTRLVGPFADVSSVGGEDRRHYWQVDGPLGRPLEWETALVDSEPGEYMRWETLEGAPIPYTATVQFEPAPDDRGTEISLRVEYEPPGGALGDATMQRLGIVPATLAGEALQRCKSLVETGEIPSIERNPSGRGSGDLL